MEPRLRVLVLRWKVRRMVSEWARVCGVVRQEGGREAASAGGAGGCCRSGGWCRAGSEANSEESEDTAGEDGVR